MKLTLLQCRSFLSLAETLSFTAAAERLHIKQSTLSSTIQNLEATVGAKLFDRDTRKVRLTALGVEFKRMANRLLDEAERTEAELRHHVSGERGSLRIAALPNIFPTLLKNSLAEFRIANPGIRLQFADVTSDEAIRQIRHDQADVAIALQISEDADLRYRFLDEHRYVALLPKTHALASRDKIAWQDILKEDLISVQSRDSVGLRIGKILREAGVAPAIAYRVNELATAVGLLEAGFGIGLMAHHSALHALRPGLVMRDLFEPAIVGKVCLITHAEKEWTPAVKQIHEIFLRNAPKPAAQKHA
jgi:LysR family transcriptional regulator, carnitine catabolism transcriptional activator